MDNETRPVEIKDLNKTQLILLAILLSFVISIATAIVTATLLQQAPPAVTQTINRVVQQTIEKVAPDYTPGTTQTVVVKEDDLVVDAVSKTRGNLFSILEKSDSKDSTGDAYSVGKGMFIAKASLLDQTKTYIVRGSKGDISVKVTSLSNNGIALLSPLTAGDAAIKDFPASDFGKDSDIKAGQTVIVVSTNSIVKDIVQAVSAKDLKDKDGVVSDSWNVVTLGDSLSSSMGGAPVANLDGNIIGFVGVITNADGSVKTQVVGIDSIQKLISSPSNVSKVSDANLSASVAGATTQ